MGQMGLDRDLRHIGGIDLGVTMGMLLESPTRRTTSGVHAAGLLLGSTMATLEFFIAATVRRFLQRR